MLAYRARWHLVDRHFHHNKINWRRAVPIILIACGLAMIAVR